MDPLGPGSRKDLGSGSLEGLVGTTWESSVPPWSLVSLFLTWGQWRLLWGCPVKPLLASSFPSLCLAGSVSWVPVRIPQGTFYMLWMPGKLQMLLEP